MIYVPHDQDQVKKVGVEDLLYISIRVCVSHQAPSPKPNGGQRVPCAGAIRYAISGF